MGVVHVCISSLSETSTIDVEHAFDDMHALAGHVLSAGEPGGDPGKKRRVFFNDLWALDTVSLVRQCRDITVTS
jgi:hypothetical protein